MTGLARAKTQPEIIRVNTTHNEKIWCKIVLPDRVFELYFDHRTQNKTLPNLRFFFHSSDIHLQQYFTIFSLNSTRYMSEFQWVYRSREEIWEWKSTMSINDLKNAFPLMNARLYWRTCAYIQPSVTEACLAPELCMWLFC